MSEATKRHPNVVNAAAVPAIERLTGTRFGGAFRILGEAAGARAIGCSLAEVPPGRAAYPTHYHCANEEAIYVLDGRGEVRIGADTVPIGPGDFVAFPVGPEHAHQVRNTGDATLRYLALSTKHNVEVVGYPDSKKVAAAAWPPGSRFGDANWHRLIVEESSAVDYFKGEKID